MTKAYIDMNNKIYKNPKNNFEKDFFRLMNNEMFGKTMTNNRKHEDINFVADDKKENCLVSEPNYRATKRF